MLRCFFDIIDSTNTEAKRIIARELFLPNIFSIISTNQSQGRGKLGNSWKSSSGNLHLSIVINLDKYLDEFKNISLISILTSLALRETLNYFVSKESIKILNYKKITEDNQKTKSSVNILKPYIMSKWPNDILVNIQGSFAKIAGILLEVEKNHQGKDYLIIGIGVNLLESPILDKYKTISLFDIISKKINISDFTDILENKFLNYLKVLQYDKGNIINKFKENLYCFGEQIQISLGDTIKTGVFCDITEEGYLILEDNNNKIIVTAGEIFGF